MKHIGTPTEAKATIFDDPDEAPEAAMAWAATVLQPAPRRHPRKSFLFWV